jgi:uncharacterized protein
MNITVKYTIYSARVIFILVAIGFSTVSVLSQKSDNNKKVISFYGRGESDMGHKSFIREANRWFSLLAKKYKFTYDSTNDWKNLNDEFLSKYSVVIFLDSRPDSIPQRKALERYMESGGSFMGFHFSAFTLTPSEFPQNWDWYHNKFIGAGEYKGNTWKPTTAVLSVEDNKHPSTRNLPATFTSSPNEWYSWQNDLRLNGDIKILLSIDTSSYPLGTGPKLNEIWHSGYYPVVWTNTKYKMLYLNMGHNDIDYEGKSNKELSQTFGNPIQDRLVTDGLLWLLKMN